MAETAPLRVQLIAKTEFLAPPDVPWSTDADGGPALVEFAGRACYQSWSKPNPRTATNAAYLRHIIDVGHFSVLEHASVSFYITGVSRSCTHELIRHRHFSYSQLSQRYVPEHDSQVVLPPGMEDDQELAADLHRGRRRQPRRPTPNCWPGSRPSSPTSPNARAAPQTGPSGRPRGAAERHRDPHRRDRQLPGLAALHRHAGQRTGRRGDPQAGDRVPAPTRRRRARRPSPTSRSPRWPTAPRSRRARWRRRAGQSSHGS